MLLLSFYAPTSGQDEEFLESISHLSDFISRNSVAGDQILIGADSNCSTKSSSRRQIAWKSFCEKFDLKQHNSPLPSFHHHNGLSESFIDVFVASETLDLGKVLQYCTLNTPLNLSSHDPIQTKISVQLAMSNRSSIYSSTYSEFGRQRIKWDAPRLSEYQKLASSALSDALCYWDTPETIPLLSSLISKLLVTCASQVFPSKSCSPRPPPTKKPSLRVRQAQNTLEKTFNVWKKAGKPTPRNNPTRAAYSDTR